MEWERLNRFLRRTRTPEGWLVKYDDGDSVSLCYVPDPLRQWLAEGDQPENVA